MDVEYPGFGSIVINGQRFDRDMVVDRGALRPRKKGPSKAQRGAYGHTPLTAAEDLPWSGSRLVIGTGASGRLPIAQDMFDEAEARGVEIVAFPTSEACDLLQSVEADHVCAVLHVTC